MSKLKIILMVVLLSAFASAQEMVKIVSTVSNPVISSSPTKPNGYLVITNKAFTAPDGTKVVENTKGTQVPVVNGNVSFTIVPNCDIPCNAPSSFYSATYFLNDGKSWSESWQVPSTPTQNIIGNITVSQINLSQSNRGLTGQGFTWRNAWDIGTPYYAYDVVSYGGSTYICLVANTGNAPTDVTKWNLFTVGSTGGSGTPGGPFKSIQWNNVGLFDGIPLNSTSTIMFLAQSSANGGVGQFLQPAFSQLAGSATCGQLPALTGDITSSGCATSLAHIVAAATNTKITYDVTGRVTGGAQAQFTDIGGVLGSAQFPTLTGDVSNSGLAITLATVNSNVGTFGDASHTLQATLDAKGRVTAVAAVAISIPYSSVTGTPTLYNQRIQSNTTNQNQRTNLNFGSDFTVSDSAGSDRTSISLVANSVTVTAGSGLAGGGAVSLGNSITLSLGTIAIGNTQLTTRGDLLTVNSGGTLARFAIGSANSVLMGGTDLVYGAVPSCGDSTHALNFDTTAHAFGCQALSGGGSVTSVFGRSGVVVAASGDYTAAQVTNAFDVTTSNILTNVVAGGTPSAGFLRVWSDSTNKIFTAKNDAGVISHTAQTKAAVSNNFVTAFNDDGSFTTAQPSFTNLFGSISLAQTVLTTRGDLLTVNATPAMTRLAIGAADTALMGGTDLSFVAINNCGDATHALAYSTSTHTFGCQAISGGVTSVFGRTGAVIAATGDYTAAQVTNAFDITSANVLTNAVAGATPSAGFLRVWADSTNKIFEVKNESGVISHTAQTKAVVSNNFLTGFADDGSYSSAQPSFSNLSGSITLAQTVLTTRGDILVVNSTPALARLAVGAADTVFMGGTDPLYIAVNNCGDSTHALSYNTSTHTWGCQLITASGASVTLDAILAATGPNTINNGDHSGQRWNWSQTTTSTIAMRFSENVAGIATSSYLVGIDTASGSTVKPLRVTAGSTTDGVEMSITGVLAAIGSGHLNADQCNGGTCNVVTSVFGRVGAVVATSGDYTAAQVTNAFSIIVANTLTNATAPSTPASSFVSVWADSTDLRFHDKNAAGIIGTTVVSSSASTNQFATGISVAGVISYAQPAFSNLSGSLACGQFPTLTGDVTNSACAITVTKINGTSLAALATGILKNTTVTGVPSIATGGTDYEFPLTFSAPLVRSTNVISCPTCGVTGTGLGQFAATSSATLAGVITDETGSNALVFAHLATIDNVTVNQNANGDTAVTVVRKTNVSPTGLAIDIQSATNATVCSISVAGVLAGCSIPYALLTGTPVTGVSSVFSRTGAVVATSGDYTAAQVTNAFSIIVANTLTNVAAPSTPASGFVGVWADSTDLRFHDKNSAGIIGTTVVSSSAGSNQFATGISVAGILSYAQPAFSNLSGSIACGQYAALTGDVTTSGCAATLALSGVIAGTYTKITVDVQGRAIVGATASASDLSNGTTGSTLIVLAHAATLDNTTVNQNANGDTALTVVRKTNTSPTGLAVDIQSATNASVCSISVAGVLANCSIPYALLTGTPAAGVSSVFGRTGAVVATLGDYTAAQVTNAFSVLIANTLTNVSAPSTPSSGLNSVWSDSTDLRFHDKNSAGVIGTTVVASSAGSNQFATGISVAGILSYAQPTFSNLSGSLSCSQLPSFTGDVTNSACAMTVGKINGVSLAGLATGILKNTTTTGVPSIATGGTDYEFPLTFTSPLQRSTNTISMTPASATQSGYVQSPLSLGFTATPQIWDGNRQIEGYVSIGDNAVPGSQDFFTDYFFAFDSTRIAHGENALNVRTAYTGPDVTGSLATVVMGQNTQLLITPSADIVNGVLYFAGRYNGVVQPISAHHVGVVLGDITEVSISSETDIAYGAVFSVQNHYNDSLPVQTAYYGILHGAIAFESSIGRGYNDDNGATAVASILENHGHGSVTGINSWIYSTGEIGQADGGDQVSLYGNTALTTVARNGVFGWQFGALRNLNGEAYGIFMADVTAGFVGVLTSDGINPANASTVVIGSKTYTFKSTLAGCSANDIKIDGTDILTLTNLQLALGVLGTAGTNYCAGTTSNSSVTFSQNVNINTYTANNTLQISADTAITITGTTHIVATAPVQQEANVWESNKGAFKLHDIMRIDEYQNGVDLSVYTRATDSSPTGYFVRLRNHADNTDLWAVDISGVLQAGTIPGARVSGNISGNAGTATALAANGTNCSAGSFPLGVDASGNSENCTATVPTLVTTAFSATPTFTATSSVLTTFFITLTGNVTSSTFAGGVTAQQVNFQICQDGTGGRTFVFPTSVKGGFTVGSTASKCNVQSFFWDGTNLWATSTGVINQ